MDNIFKTKVLPLSVLNSCSLSEQIRRLPILYNKGNPTAPNSIFIIITILKWGKESGNIYGFVTLKQKILLLLQIFQCLCV